LLEIPKQGIIKPTKCGTAHIPVDIRNNISQTEIHFILHNKTAILYTPNATEKRILKDLDKLKEDIQTHIGKKKK